MFVKIIFNEKFFDIILNYHALFYILYIYIYMKEKSI